MFDSFPLFCSMAVAVVLEATPFLLLGSFIGALFEVFVSDRLLERFIPQHGIMQVLAGICAGMVLPTCECGVVPIARRLLLRGVPVRMVLPYMLAAPVVNPVVLLSTYVAFQSDVSMVSLRVLFVVASACLVAWGLWKYSLRSVLRFVPLEALPMAQSKEHGQQGSCACAACTEGAVQSSPFMQVVTHTALEFLSMGRFLVLGACLAAAFKVFMPMGAIQFFAKSPVFSIGGMMLFAVVSSVCSEADAFVAAGFSMLPRAAQLAFTAIGPMVDVKLLGMFLITFKRKIVFVLTAVPLVVVFVLSLAAHWLGGRM